MASWLLGPQNQRIYFWISDFIQKTGDGSAPRNSWHRQSLLTSLEAPKSHVFLLENFRWLNVARNHLVFVPEFFYQFTQLKLLGNIRKSQRPSHGGHPRKVGLHHYLSFQRTFLGGSNWQPWKTMVSKIHRCFLEKSFGNQVKNPWWIRFFPNQKRHASPFFASIVRKTHCVFTESLRYLYLNHNMLTSIVDDFNHMPWLRSGLQSFFEEIDRIRVDDDCFGDHAGDCAERVKGIGNESAKG